MLLQNLSRQALIDLIDKANMRLREIDLSNPDWEHVGNEAAKRAILVAAVSNRHIILVGRPGNWEQNLIAGASLLGARASFVSPCPCGNLSDPRAACKCSVSTIKRHQSKWTKFPELWVMLHSPSESDIRNATSGRNTRLNYFQDMLFHLKSKDITIL